MEDILGVGEGGEYRRLLWDSGSIGRVESCPKSSKGTNVPAFTCLSCIYYGGFFDGQNRAVNVPQVAIGAGKVRRAEILVCTTSYEALEAAKNVAESAKKTEEDRKEKDLRTQVETAKKKAGKGKGDGKDAGAGDAKGGDAGDNADAGDGKGGCGELPDVDESVL